MFWRTHHTEPDTSSMWVTLLWLLGVQTRLDKTLLAERHLFGLRTRLHISVQAKSSTGRICRRRYEIRRDFAASPFHRHCDHALPASRGLLQRILWIKLSQEPIAVWAAACGFTQLYQNLSALRAYIFMFMCVLGGTQFWGITMGLA